MKIARTRNLTQGFTLVEIMIVVAIIGLLAVIAVPNHVRARQESQRKLCVNNIRLIEAAIDQYAIETKQKADAPVDGNILAPYLKHGTDTACPAGGTTIFNSYNLVDCQTPVTCQKDVRHAVD